jgi:hypothetical protein
MTIAMSMIRTFSEKTIKISKILIFSSINSAIVLEIVEERHIIIRKQQQMCRKSHEKVAS